MTCEVKSPNDLEEVPIIGWSLNSAGVTSSTSISNTKVNQIMKSVLTIEKLTPLDSGHYVCSAAYKHIGSVSSPRAKLTVPGITLVRPQVWVTTGVDATVKFQCRGILSTSYDTISYEPDTWTSTLAEYYSKRVISISKSIIDLEEVLTVTISGSDTRINGLEITCFILSSSDPATLLDWHSTTLNTIGFPIYEYSKQKLLF